MYYDISGLAGRTAPLTCRVGQVVLMGGLYGGLAIGDPLSPLMQSMATTLDGSILFWPVTLLMDRVGDVDNNVR